MPKRNSNVKIVEGKVVLSDEVLNIIENWRTEENSEWVDKYLEIISDPSNIGSKKSREHHIIPCFVFKDEEHKNRKETEPLADEIKGNKIKLSIANHMICHYYLWKIIKSEDSRRAVYMSFNKKNINYLSENEIKKFARIQEECSKENQTEEEILKRQKEYRKNHKEDKKKYDKKWRKENIDKISKQRKEHYNNNKEEILKQNKTYRENNRDKVLEGKKKSYENNKEKIKELYENNKEEILKQQREYRKNNREKILKRRREKRKNNKEKTLEYERNWREKK